MLHGKQKINGPYSLGNPKELAALLNQFFSYTEPDIEGSCALTPGTGYADISLGGSLAPPWVKRAHPVRRMSPKGACYHSPGQTAWDSRSG